MSCPVCHGYSSEKCPVCGQTEMVVCPDCQGDGLVYLAFDLITRMEFRVSKKEYFSLPIDEDDAVSQSRHECRSEAVKCHTCGGSGEIESY